MVLGIHGGRLFEVGAKRLQLSLSSPLDAPGGLVCVRDGVVQCEPVDCLLVADDQEGAVVWKVPGAGGAGGPPGYFRVNGLPFPDGVEAVLTEVVAAVGVADDETFAVREPAHLVVVEGPCPWGTPLRGDGVTPVG